MVTVRSLEPTSPALVEVLGAKRHPVRMFGDPVQVGLELGPAHPTVDRATVADDVEVRVGQVDDPAVAGIWKEVQLSEIRQQQMLLTAYRKRNLPAHFQKNWNKTKKKLAKQREKVPLNKVQNLRYILKNLTKINS